MSGIISTSSSSSSGRRFQVKPGLDRLQRLDLALGGVRLGGRLGHVDGEIHEVAEAAPFGRAGRPQHVVLQEPALLHPVGDDVERHFAVDGVGLDDPDVEEAAFFGHERSTLQTLSRGVTAAGSAVVIGGGGRRAPWRPPA